ncbi:hypothetical protein WKI65_38180 [Streptomyces sp. MS1.AVA.3]|uniref:hypothetical protein n=1 Tax=Streptomyces decoyicus TaxID=249567 RepID=UPI0030BA9C73
MNEDLTTPDRADRARVAWELYRDLHGEEIHYLIADLMHLADVDEHSGGGAHAAQRAVSDYIAEQPVWPTEPEVPVHLGQIRPAGQDWTTVATGDDTVEPMHVAGCLRGLLRKAELRASEIQMHIERLARGEVVTASNGTAFRVIKNPANDG